MFFQAGQQQGCLSVSRGMLFPFSLANQCAGWLADLQVSSAQTHGRASKVRYKHFSSLPGLTKRWAQTSVFLASRRAAAHNLDTTQLLQLGGWLCWCCPMPLALPAAEAPIHHPGILHGTERVTGRSSRIIVS